MRKPYDKKHKRFRYPISCINRKSINKSLSQLNEIINSFKS